MVIRALVRARLFGVQLLTLEASVVVGTDDGNWPATSSLLLSPDNPTGQDLRSLRPELAASGSGTMYARAIELLEQGTDTLERSRRPRLDPAPLAATGKLVAPVTRRFQLSWGGARPLKILKRPLPGIHEVRCPG